MVLNEFPAFRNSIFKLGLYQCEKFIWSLAVIEVGHVYDYGRRINKVQTGHAGGSFEGNLHDPIVSHHQNSVSHFRIRSAGKY